MRTFLIFPGVEPEKLARLEAAAPQLRFVNAADAAVAQQEIVRASGFFGKMTPELLACATQLEWIQTPTASLEHYLFPALVPIALFLSSGWLQLADRAVSGTLVRMLTTSVLAGAIGWAFGEVHGSLRAAELWSDNALIAAAAVGVVGVLLAPRVVRARLPDGLGLTLALTVGLLDLAALVKFVAPAFPLR